jgi:hypothetical protein
MDSLEKLKQLQDTYGGEIDVQFRKDISTCAGVTGRVIQVRTFIRLKWSDERLGCSISSSWDSDVVNSSLDQTIAEFSNQLERSFPAAR